LRVGVLEDHTEGDAGFEESASGRDGEFGGVQIALKDAGFVKLVP